MNIQDRRHPGYETALTLQGVKKGTPFVTFKPLG